jgi:hypothetical protein
MAIVLTQQDKQSKSGIVPCIKAGHMAAPALTTNVDYSTFEHSPEELGKLLTLKKKNREERKKEYGTNASKHLNIAARSIGESLHFTF